MSNDKCFCDDCIKDRAQREVLRLDFGRLLLSAEEVGISAESLGELFLLNAWQLSGRAGLGNPQFLLWAMKTLASFDDVTVKVVEEATRAPRPRKAQAN